MGIRHHQAKLFLARVVLGVLALVDIHLAGERWEGLETPPGHVARTHP